MFLTIATAAFMLFTGYAWIRLDSLMDRYAAARPGGRIRRSLIRQIGAMTGWWLLALSLPMWATGSAVIALPLTSAGALLVALAIAARRLCGAPLFWPAA